MTSNQPPHQPPAGAENFSEEHFAELKRDMRQAKILAWVANHRQNLIAGVVALILILTFASVWIERQKSQNSAAALNYIQALNMDSKEKRTEKVALLKQITSDYDDRIYAPLSHFLLAALEPEQAVSHLQAVIDHDKSSPELRKQAMLDLASYWLANNDKVKAKAAIAETMGGDYEAARNFLLAEASESKDEQIALLKKAQEVKVKDQGLNDRIDARLKLLESNSAEGAAAAPADSSATDNYAAPAADDYAATTADGYATPQAQAQ